MIMRFRARAMVPRRTPRAPYTAAVRRQITLTYDRARSLLLISGLILIGVVALVALVRRVDPIEVAATFLFVPVFAGFLFFGAVGGLVTGLLAGVAYVVLRWPSIEMIGLGPLLGQLGARLVGYLGFGLGGGWAVQQIRGTLEKLELHDEIDDETGLGNARSVLETADVERARADRYQKVFSLVAVDFIAPKWDELSGRRQRAALREFGTKLAAGVRSSDHVAHARRGDHHIVGLVLPETAVEGARIVADNLRRQLAAIVGSDELRVIMATHPMEADNVQKILSLFREIDRSQRPAHEEDD